MRKKVLVRVCDWKRDNMRSGFHRPARNPCLIFLRPLSIGFTCKTKWKLRIILQTKLTVWYEQINEQNLFIIRRILFQIPIPVD